MNRSQSIRLCILRCVSVKKLGSVGDATSPAVAVSGFTEISS